MDPHDVLVLVLERDKPVDVAQKPLSKTVARRQRFGDELQHDLVPVTILGPIRLACRAATE